MANTVIRIKKSGVTGNVPGSLALGELAINYTDGLLYFANSTGVASFSADASIIANAAFAQANAAYNQANTGGSSTDSFARNQANLAYNQANASFNVANTSLANTGSLITVNGSSQLYVSNTANSYSTTNNALTISGSIGVANSIYVGNRVGYANSNNISVMYQFYNGATNSYDLVFG